MVYSGQDLGLGGGFGDPFNVYSNFSSAKAGTAPASSAPTLVTVSDDDANLNAEGAGSNQVLSSTIDMDGTVIGPAGSSVTVLATSTVTNTTTGETGFMYVIEITNVNGISGNNVAIGYASTIEVNPGDSIIIGKWITSQTTVIYDSLVGSAACFAAGTRIACPDGWRNIESIEAGDLVLTEAGSRPVLWRSMRQVNAIGVLSPIHIPSGILGATGDLFVSPDHRLLLQGQVAQLLFDCDALWVYAADLVNDTTIRRAPRAHIAYHHLLLDGHFRLLAEGCAAESLDPMAISDAHMRASIPPEFMTHEYYRRLARLKPAPSALIKGYGPTFNPS